MKKQQGFIEELGIGLVAVVIGAIVLGLVGGGIWWRIYSNTNHHNVTFTVKKTERVEDRYGKSAKYLVFTDTGVYQNTDSLLNGKFNSSDLYNQIEVNKKYSCDAVGFRNGFWSWYENLIKCEEVK